MLLRLTLGAKIFSGFLAVLLTFGAVSGFAVWRIAQVGDRLRANQAYLALAQPVNDLDNRQEQFGRVVASRKERTTYWRRFRMTKIDQAISAAQRAHRADFEQRLRAMAADAAGEEALYAEADAGSADAQAKLELRETRLAHEVRTLKLDVDDLVEQVAGEVEREGNHLTWATLLLVVMALVVGAVVTFGAHLALRPLVRLTRQVEAVGRGEYRVPLESRSSDEVGELARAFARMAAALEEREQALIRSERLAATGRIAAQITHEIRNPLSSIGLNAELLADELSSSPDAERLLAAISREVDRLTEITEQYLRFARLPQPKLEPEDLGVILRQLADFSREECARQKVELEVHAEAAPAMADENQMRQALLNLIRNAREAMPSGGRIVVSSGIEGAHAVVRVRDSGPGIPDQARARIFEPFFSTKEGGTGLGLALTQQIVAQHGGRIEIDSSAEGTTFVVRLPVLDPAARKSDDRLEANATP